MSVQAEQWVAKNSRQKGSAFLLLTLIAKGAGTDGRNRNTTIQRLAADSRLDRSTVSRNLHLLEESGELVCETRGTGRSSSVWFLPGVVREGYHSNEAKKRFSVRFIDRVCFAYIVEAYTKEEAEAMARVRTNAGDEPDEEWSVENESGPEVIAEGEI
ncbi:MAG: hypothetical protein ACLQVM_28755 [Terriglobia bacterium]